MTKTSKAPKNLPYTAAKTITVGIALLAMVISYTHIVDLFQGLGLAGWQGYAAPIFIDGFGLLGLLARGNSFAPETRKLGKIFQVAATLVSLVANVMAGHTIGGQVFGAMVVLGYIAAETLAERMVSIQAADATTAKATRSAAATKAAATRKANAAKAPATRKPAARRLRSVQTA